MSKSRSAIFEIAVLSRVQRAGGWRLMALLIGALLAVTAVVCASVYIRVRDALSEASAAAAKSGIVAVSIKELQSSASAFEPVAPTADFRSVAAFDGNLFVCGRSGLFQYRDGELRRTWTVGRDLPPFPLRTLAVRTGISKTELWVATERAGILIYDGVRLRQLLPDDAALRQVTALLPVRNGRVLVGTADSGLYLSDGKSLRLFHPQFAKTRVTALAGDEDALWVGTRNEGAWFWRGGQALHVLDVLPDANVLSIAAREQRAWIGTAIGVTELTSGALTRRLADGVFARALAEHNGSLWIGTIDQGTVSIPIATHAALRSRWDVGAGAHPIVAFAEIDKHLVAVDESSVRALPSGSPIVTAPDNSLTNGHVTGIHADGRGRLWVGYFDRGLDIIDPQAHANSLTHFEDDVLFCVNRIKEDPDRGITAVATANGLALFNASGQLKQVLDRDHGLVANHVTDVLFRRDNENRAMIVGTPAGLSFIDDAGISAVSGFQGLVNNHVYTLADVSGTLYAGTLGGISAIRSGIVQASFTTANSQLRQNWITASASAGRRLYLGTYGSGVVQLERDGSVITSPAFAKQRIEVNPNAMLATARAIYAGTSCCGMAVLRQGDERWRFVTTGLPSLNVTAFDERGGELYVGTDNGLVRIPENSLLP
ncbi:MAG: hypothetical protein JO061_13070 [Acidobacteriaceae bacterium]|nr:hypothetical protein [Acidobacteriaceae bacterium]